MLLHKLLPLLFLPVSLAIILAFLAGWRRSRIAAFAAAGILWLCSTPVLSDCLIGTLETRFPRLDPDRATSAAAIVMLSGALHDPVPGRPLDWNFGVNRFERTLELYRAGKAPLIVFTRGVDPAGGPSRARPWSEGEFLRAEAIARGVPEAAILLTTEEVGNTEQEAAAVARLAGERQWDRVLLVTSAFHVPRAVLLCESRGLAVIPFPAGYLAEDRALHPEFNPLRYLPDAEALRNSQLAVREWLGIAYYGVAKKDGR